MSQKKRRCDFSTKLQKSRIFVLAENKQTNDDNNTAGLRRAGAARAPCWKVCSRAGADSKRSAVRRPGHCHAARPWRTAAGVKTAHAALAQGFQGACAKQRLGRKAGSPGTRAGWFCHLAKGRHGVQSCLQRSPGKSSPELYSWGNAPSSPCRYGSKPSQDRGRQQQRLHYPPALQMRNERPSGTVTAPQQRILGTGLGLESGFPLQAA